ncbi:GNAT family N-acetyltransferase [Salinicola tamaricis]|uniref:GNAT family N-acetyltransferase n=1 Tax=Salinicola tamaricis TaxID=1771309 RepID=UPI001F5D52FB|nr:GNAT family N-acetyltransferase [Salinicola tamaricis]
MAASLRLRTPVSIREPVTIGRVVIAQDHRGAGLGHRLMAAALEHLTERWPGRDAYLSAQAHLQNYYAGHGFVAVTDTYLEDNIPHIGMYRHGG